MARYRGRFAPTPSGPLHFGSLVAAVGSYLDARLNGGEWLVRMEDLDPPRVVPGAADSILRTLEAFGFAWDGPILWQSSRSDAYRAAFESLRRQSFVYACGCSRAGCTGNCRTSFASGGAPLSWRVCAPETRLEWDDALCGLQNDVVPEFVVLRADGIFAYQLAVVVDDAFQEITDVVRGADLLDSTPRQIWLQHLLGYASPRYSHLPVALNERGEKLSKQTHAPPICERGDSQKLSEAFRFLGRQPPKDAGTIAEIWRWALKR